METEKMARVLVNMYLDMDYADYEDVIEQGIANVKKELDALDKDSILYRVLESITDERSEWYAS